MKLIHLHSGIFFSTLLVLSLILAGCGSKAASSYSAAQSGAGDPGTPPPGGGNVPTVTVTAGSSSIAYNGSTTISWTSTNSTSCSSSGGGGTSTSGSFSTGALTATTTYTVTCTGTGGSASQGKTVTVAPSVITAFANAGSGNVTVTSANSLSAGMIITISGTTNYNGTFTIVSATSTSFVITTTYVANDATGTWQLAGGMISGCSTTGDTSAITLSMLPARFNGVAPLTVFFDASATTDASVTTRPFHDLEYRWNFGDTAGSPVSGTTWATGSRPGVSSRNTATGPVSAHVYEAAGTYIVAMSATDGTNSVANSCAQIVVQDPEVVFAGTKTTCVATSTLPVAGVGGCPTGSAVATQSSFTTAISNYALTGKRVLFKTGDTFTAATEARISQTGPGLVGSYGSTARPIIQSTGGTSQETMGFADTSNTTWKDWRVMDLAFDGLNHGTTSSGVTGIGVTGNSGGINQLTVLRVSLSNFYNAIGFAADALNYDNMQNGHSHTLDQIAVVDSESHAGSITSNTGYNAGTRIAFMGNSFDNGGNVAGSHVLRFTYLNKAVISNNDLMRPGFTRHAIKLHATTWTNGVVSSSSLGSGVIYSSHSDNASWSNYSASINGDGYTKYVIISDNKFVAAAEPWAISMGPQTPDYDERVQDVILERNLHVMNSTSQVAQVVHASEITIRNNLFLGGGGGTQSGVLVEMDGSATNHEPPASNVRVYNNTQYSPDHVPGNQFIMVDIEDAYASTARVNNITIKNNLAYAPVATSPLLYMNPKNAPSVTVSNNSTNSQITSTNPLFTATPSTTISNWMITAGSYAINSGATVPVWSDFFGNVRPKNGVIDIGAAEAP